MSGPAAGPAAGEAVELDVERIAYGGDGVGRADGLVVFVPWTAPGERVRARIVERHPRYARARLEGVLAAVGARVEPGCPVFGICGGCQFQHLDRASQLESKARAVSDAFERIAGTALPAALSCEPAAQPWHYRRRATFTWQRSEAGSALGFHAAEDPAAIVDVEA
ncbi:MAG TPA: TRAM domain-containing protein, partial [Gemmatimonadota bacterium]|nr:TRAM domain-containing protein [Gemmatimonadota bacterium]